MAVDVITEIVIDRPRDPKPSSNKTAANPDLSFPRRRESRFVAQRMSLDTRLPEYDRTCREA